MKDVIDVGFFRVSKEDETKQDLERHIQVTKERFNTPEDLLILCERISAYDEDKLEKRAKFLKLLTLVTNLDEITGLDIFRGRLKPKAKIVNIYTYDYNRFSRIMEYALMFHICMSKCRINIYSYNQPHMIGQKLTDKSSPDTKLSYYIQCGILSYGAEYYSYNTSQNIGKSVKKSEGGMTIGTKEGIKKKWGGFFIDLEGNRIEDYERSELIYLDSIRLINHYESNGESRYSSKIIKYIEDNHSCKLSRNYISRTRNKILEGVDGKDN